MRRELDIKSKMVLEICSLSTTAIVCPHRPHPVNKSSRFIDWYRILALDENANLEIIKKGYHKLDRIDFGCSSLQRHPDKNKHPKAEIAFKLVLEAYSSLSKREMFDLERWKNFCIEEAKVIVKCLRPSKREESESPIFNPSGNFIENNNGRFRSPNESPVSNPSDAVFQGTHMLGVVMFTRSPNSIVIGRGEVFSATGESTRLSLRIDHRGKCSRVNLLVSIHNLVRLEDSILCC